MILQQVIPNMIPPIIVQATLALAYAILAEAGLSFLGLGTQPPKPSWGRRLSEGRDLLGQAPWLSIFPGLVIMLAVLGFNIEEVADPKQRVNRVKELTGGGPHVVLECSGFPGAVLEGVGMLRNDGRYFVIGQYSFSGPIALNPEDITLRELRLQGSQSFEPEDVFTYLNVLRRAQATYPIHEVVSHRFPLEKANDALQAVARKEAVRAVLVP